MEGRAPLHVHHPHHRPRPQQMLGARRVHVARRVVQRHPAADGGTNAAVATTRTQKHVRDRHVRLAGFATTDDG